jgi:hypothetical protein
LIFLDGSDHDDERRFSLAHEVAHFLCDYLEPREKALRAIGEAGRDVLDGRRPATPEERLTGILRGVKVGTYTHLMDRSTSGEVNHIQVIEAEDRADRLALELLAPRSTVLSRLKTRRVDCGQTYAFDIARETLMQEFGLPAAVAQGYGRMLVMDRSVARTFRSWLGI